MNPLFVREVQPPLIYVGGDGRLNNTQSNKSIYYLFIYVLSSIVFLSRSSLFLMFESCESRGSRGEWINLGKPIATALPDGVPPGHVGFRVFKCTRRLSCVSHCRSGLLRRELRCITPGVEGTRDVFVCQQRSWCIAGFVNMVGIYGVFPSLSCYDELSFPFEIAFYRIEYLYGFENTWYMSCNWILMVTMDYHIDSLDISFGTRLADSRGDIGVIYA